MKIKGNKPFPWMNITDIILSEVNKTKKKVHTV